MKHTSATGLASASMMTFAHASILDLTNPAFANTFDGGLPASATFDGVIGASSVFADLIFANPIGAFEFTEIALSAGDAFLVSADISDAPGFNAVFATATIGSIEFSQLPVSAVPLPAGLPLILTGVSALGLVRRKD